MRDSAGRTTSTKGQETGAALPRVAMDERRDGIVCALLVVAAVMLTHPRAAMPFVDEWSYTGSSLVMATSGRLQYFGESAMVGWQIPWGALFFKIFGFSFDVARSSMLPFTPAVVFLMHACLRRFGIRGNAAVLGALTLGLSPLFIPVATSFMTDIGALFGVLLCLYLCQRAIGAGTDRATAMWLCGATASNVILGTDRQVVWLGALVMVPSTAWLLRRRRGVLPVAMLLWIASLGIVLAGVHWFNHQPNILPAKMSGAITVRRLLSLVLEMGLKLPACLLVLALPVTAVALAQLRDLGRGAMLRVGAVAAGVLACFGVLASMGRLESAVMPWLRPMIGNLGMWRTNDELPGVREVTLGLWPRAAVTLVAAVAVMALVEWLWSARASGKVPPPEGDPVTRWSAIVWTIGIYSAAYVVLLIPIQLFKDGVYDRYVLFLLPLAVIVLLKFFQEHVTERIPALCYGVLAVFAVYTVMATHDWYAMLRARVANADRMQATGVPRTSVVGGWEYDAWTQIQAQGFLNYKEAVWPPGKGYVQVPMRKRPCERGLVDWTPAIDPKYVVAYSPLACYAASEFPPFVYRTWLPPFQRKLFVLRVPGDD